jgi:hypothetical protein
MSPHVTPLLQARKRGPSADILIDSAEKTEEDRRRQKKTEKPEKPEKGDAHVHSPSRV